MIDRQSSHSKKKKKSVSQFFLSSPGKSPCSCVTTLPQTRPRQERNNTHKPYKKIQNTCLASLSPSVCACVCVLYKTRVFII